MSMNWVEAPLSIIAKPEVPELAGVPWFSWTGTTIGWLQPRSADITCGFPVIPVDPNPFDPCWVFGRSLTGAYFRFPIFSKTSCAIWSLY